ncbi:MAG: DUF2187 family protein [Psychrobacillus sp.]
MNTSNNFRKVEPPNNGVAIDKFIEFTRHDKKITGQVVHIRELSVIVKLEAEDVQFLGLENELTVVNHKKYKVI